MVVYGLFHKISVSGTAFFGGAIACFAIEQGFNVIPWDIAHAVGSFLIYFGAGVVLAQGSFLVQLADLASGWLLAICMGGTRRLRMELRLIAAIRQS
jgi:hypothetical protein